MSTILIRRHVSKLKWSNAVVLAKYSLPDFQGLNRLLDKCKNNTGVEKSKSIIRVILNNNDGYVSDPNKHLVLIWDSNMSEAQFIRMVSVNSISEEERVMFH